jgi:hypothetical protein
MNTIKFIVIVSIALLSTDLIYHRVVNGQNSSSMVDKLIQDTQKGELYRTELIKGNIKLKWLDIIKISVKGTIAKNAIKKD